MELQWSLFNYHFIIINLSGMKNTGTVIKKYDLGREDFFDK